MFQLHALPIMVKKIEFYGPPPCVGRQVPVRVDVMEYDAPGRQVRCNIEIEDGEGCVWARVVEWTDWVFDCRPEVADVLRDPFRHAVTEELRLPGMSSDAVCSFLLNNRVRDPIVAESLASSYLQLSELHELDAMSHDGARNRAMLARIAAKDATRIWWSRRYHAAWPHPASFVIEHDERGKPTLQPGEQAMPHISLSHSQAASVAVASAVPVGIDLEPLSRRTSEALDQFTTADEREFLRACSDQTAATQLWCCKEAVAKLLGTGFDRVSPRDIQLIDREGDTLWLLQDTRSGDRFEVHTTAYQGYILAFTTQTGVRAAHVA
jgi:phosphopantetheinyl transferase